MTSVPGRQRWKVFVIEEDRRPIGILEDAVDDDVVLGEKSGQRLAVAVLGVDVATADITLARIELDDPRRVDRGGNRSGIALRQDIHLADAERTESGDSAPSRCPEADHDRVDSTAIVTRRADQRQGMQDRRIARPARCSCAGHAG